MPRKAELTIQEFSGTQYRDLITVQIVARSAFAVDLTMTIRELLATGLLMQVNGRIIPKQSK